MTIAVKKLDAPTVRKGSEEGYAPLLRCEVCGKEIAKPDRGRIAWDPEENRTYLSVAFLHEACVEHWADDRDVALRAAPLSDFVESLERFVAGSGP